MFFNFSSALTSFISVFRLHLDALLILSLPSFPLLVCSISATTPLLLQYVYVCVGVCVLMHVYSDQESKG